MKDFIAERADDYEGPDFGMHDTEIYDRDEDGDELVQEEAASTCGICEANEPKAALTGTQQAKGGDKLTVAAEALKAAAAKFTEIREGAVVQDSAYWNEMTINGQADLAEEGGDAAREALAALMSETKG